MILTLNQTTRSKCDVCETLYRFPISKNRYLETILSIDRVSKISVRKLVLSQLICKIYNFLEKNSILISVMIFLRKIYSPKDLNQCSTYIKIQEIVIRCKKINTGSEFSFDFVHNVPVHINILTHIEKFKIIASKLNIRKFKESPHIKLQSGTYNI